ncbi:MAG TPA: DUF4252 domain-containing protein [Bryobacteraceae bacterium]|nr:DUF4252 domain-containing protein [Bryobacteraceae bacterium]
MKTLWSLVLCVALAGGGYGQALELKHLDRLEAKANDVADVTLDGALLKLATKFLSADDPEQNKIKKLVDGLKGIYVRSFEFEKEGEYSEADITTIRSQLQSKEWSRIVGVRSKKAGENAEVYINTHSPDGGLAIICADPKELTIVNIVGKIDLDELSELGDLGVPKVELEKSKPPKKDD